MRKRILVTGGAGFIGSHLCSKLVDDGHEVVCVDNLFTGDKRNIYHLLDFKNFEFIRHDITNSILLEIDEIFNLASPASPIHYQQNPIKTIKTNVLGMTNMLGLAKRVGAKILQASTSEVYGDPEQHPQKEEYWGHVNPIGVRSCYDEGKRVAETLCFDYHRQNKVDIRIVRIFNTYGPRMSPFDGRVVSNFIVQALQGKKLTIYGDGSQTRSFCFVTDLIDGLISMMNQDNTTGPINLGNPNEFTIKDLANHVISIINPSLDVLIKPLPQDDPQQRKPNIEKAKEFLNWQPKVQLNEGLTYTVDYFRQILVNHLHNLKKL